MTSSTIPAFRAALIAMLNARAGLADTNVSDGPPDPGDLGSGVYIAMLDTKGRQSIRATDRVRRPREERYTQMIEISVWAATRDDQVTIGDQAFALLAEIEDAVATNTSLAGFYSGPGEVFTVTVGEENYQTLADDSQRESRINVGLDVHARIA